jgi:hypothetical protein
VSSPADLASLATPMLASFDNKITTNKAKVDQSGNDGIVNDINDITTVQVLLSVDDISAASAQLYRAINDCNDALHIGDNNPTLIISVLHHLQIHCMT